MPRRPRVCVLLHACPRNRKFTAIAALEAGAGSAGRRGSRLDGSRGGAASAAAAGTRARPAGYDPRARIRACGWVTYCHAVRYA